MEFKKVNFKLDLKKVKLKLASKLSRQKTRF